MAALEDFENTLKEIVNAKRLSASKMSKLTDIAMKSLENDTKLVAVLYRTHKSLPNSAKVSSLYAFDALARAARSLVIKRGSTGSINAEKGNAATFLLKIEGVLDGLFQDMVSLDNSEAKEKTKKILEIWAKSTTFPSAVLTRLRDILSDVQKENAVNPTSATDPRTPPVAPTATTPSQPAPSDVQATLLALLGQAAQVTGHHRSASQTPPNNDPQVQQQAQLALLQQLARTAKLANGFPTTPTGQTPPPKDGKPHPAVIPVPEPPHSSWSSQTGGSRNDTSGDTRYARDGHLDRPRDRHSRGGFRGGYRGRGRWDDHHKQDRFRPRDRDWDPPSRPGSSRSRSPRRTDERRNVQPHSPHRRPSNDNDSHPQAELNITPNNAHGKDEFGRDIRASSNSPSRSASVEAAQALAPMDTSVDPTAGVAPDYHTLVSEQLPLVAASTSAQSAETHTPSSASQQQPGLDQFDISAFDATSPSSWEALGNMWKSTRGYTPSQEELMYFVMTGSMAAAGVADSDPKGAQGDQWQQGEPGYGARRGGRGRGNYAGGGRGGHGNYREGGGYVNGPGVTEQAEPSTYAVVLNDDVEPSNGSAVHHQDSGEQHVGRGGRMERVGDKWVFVRDVDEASSGAATKHEQAALGFMIRVIVPTVLPTRMFTAFRRATRYSHSVRTSTSSSVNADEIAHFSRLSSLWWDEHGEFALLHRMNPTRVQYIREKLIEVAREERGEDVGSSMEHRRDSLRGLDVLDVGCGGGLLSEVSLGVCLLSLLLMHDNGHTHMQSLARMGARTVGIDASESNIGIATAHAGKDPELTVTASSGNLVYRNTSAEALLEEPKRYDVVCSMEVLEHVDNPAGFLSTCAELVKPGGHLFLSTIARTPLAYLLTILAAEHVLRKVFINPSELVAFFSRYASSTPMPEVPGKPWITRMYEHGLPTRTEAEVRGLIYEPWSGHWHLMSRGATQWGAAECNYLFWVRKPSES
ncbi:hypothetical protein JVU11DRAFT_6487 [Chiua virens]|nr:hypothetical protein JVU11DRAFT_6487 [Chiua virens]